MPDGIKTAATTPNNLSQIIELFQSNITIKTLIESLAEGILIVNEEGQIVLINNRFAQMTGYNEAEVVGKSINLFIPKSHHQLHEGHLCDYFKDPRIRPMGIGMEVEAVCKDGSMLPIEITLSFLRTDSGIIGMSFITDISARKKAEKELHTRIKELDDYAHSVAHDLNSSLGGIISVSQLLMDKIDNLSPDKQHRYLTEIVKTGKKLNSIISELLLFASMKKDNIQLTPVNNKDLVNSVVDRLSDQIHDSGALINVQKNLHDCLGYGPWIEEMWFNYISNAIKYGGSPPVIDISSKLEHDGLVTFMVKDNGNGISEDLKDVIFEESNETKNKYILGHGLGLNIVKKIANKLDGYIGVESKPNHGSNFTFSFKKS